MYLETRDIDKMVEIYMAAWVHGLKTTYYLHVKPRHSAEQSTVKVNKAETSVGVPRKAGFGFSKKQEVGV
jgi:ribonucleoside-diphosphate reductase alpha chain